MIRSRVAERYAKSLLEMATEDNNVEVVEGDLSMISRAIEGSRDLQNFLATPLIDDHRKESILSEMFVGKVSPLVERFIALLARKGRASDLYPVTEAFATLLDRRRNIATAKITTAVELGAEQRSQLEARLTQMSGRNLRPQYSVDPSIVGGFQALFDDQMIDASLRHQLDRLRETLIEGRN